MGVVCVNSNYNSYRIIYCNRKLAQVLVQLLFYDIQTRMTDKRKRGKMCWMYSSLLNVDLVRFRACLYMYTSSSRGCVFKKGVG